MIWFLHGNLGRAQDWDGVRARLAQAGLSGVALNLWDERFSGDLKTSGYEIGKYIGERDDFPILCGYSLGGRLALHVVRAWPDLADRVFLLSTHWGLPSEEERSVRRITDEEWAKRLQRLPWGEFWKLWSSQGVFATDKDSAREEPRGEEKEAMVSAFRLWSLGYQEDCLPGMLKYLSSRGNFLLEASREDAGKEGGGETLLTLVTGARDEKFTRHNAEIAESLRIACREPRWCEHRVILNAGHRLIEVADQVILRR